MSNQSQWKTSTGFILASAGSAIGLGAMWKFPYMAGIYGGGAFIFIFNLYYFCRITVTDYGIYGRNNGAHLYDSNL